MWCAFARRGLGLSVVTSGPSDHDPTEAFDVPTRCSCEFIQRLRTSSPRNATNATTH